MSSNTSRYVEARPLTRSEESRLVDLESTIEDGLDTFVEVGSALAAIRDARLYRGEFGTFEEYCAKRWEISRSRAHRLIDAAAIAKNLLPTGNAPESERQVRPLVALPPAEQPAAWQRAEEIAEAEGTPIRTRHVEQAVQERKPRAPKYNTEKPPPADTLVESWRADCIRMTDAVEDTLTFARGKVLSRIWDEAAQPMIRELQKLNPARGK